MFRTSIPATADSFLDREAELRELEAHVRSLAAGTPSWVALLGPRKVGKTSLLLELARRVRRPGCAVAVLDSLEEAPPSPALLRRYALRVVDATLARDLEFSLEAVAGSPPEYRFALEHARSFAALPPALRASLLELPDAAPEPDRIREWLELPERIAQALNIHIVVAWDEFQEVSTLGGGRDGARFLALARSLWQRHRRVGYIISGSARSLLRRLVADKDSPFFQHFALMELGPFRTDDAVRLLLQASADSRQIPEPVARRAVELLGGHPFYLQLLGETLTRHDRTPGLDALKEAVQELLFCRTGRLALYFENEFHALVGRSTGLAAALTALAAGPRRLADIARALRMPAGATVRYIERLGDAVTRTERGLYALDDPVFGLWLAWRAPGGTVVPMRLVGDEAETAVAERLARMGFDLVYQSRASRGAFDLLATRGDRQLGLQVRKAELPVAFDAPAWQRMHAEGRRFRWRWAVAAVDSRGEVRFLDPARARRTRLAAGAVIPNLLRWLDAAPRR